MMAVNGNGDCFCIDADNATKHGDALVTKSDLLTKLERDRLSGGSASTELSFDLRFDLDQFLGRQHIDCPLCITHCVQFQGSKGR